MKLEAEVRFDAEKNEARLWLNGEMMPGSCWNEYHQRIEGDDPDLPPDDAACREVWLKHQNRPEWLPEGWTIEGELGAGVVQLYDHNGASKCWVEPGTITPSELRAVAAFCNACADAREPELPPRPEDVTEGEMMLLGGVDDVGRMSRVIELVKRRTLKQVAWDKEYGE